MMKYIVAFFSLCSLSQSCFAQDDQVTLQFVSFPKSSNAKPVDLLLGDGETVRVELSTNSLSPEYKVNRLRKWILGKPTTDADGKFTFDVYGQAASISSSKQLILVFRKGTKDSEEFELIVMDNQQSGFGGGDYFFMNVARVDIAVRIGDKKFALKPRKYKIVQPKPSKVKGKRKYLYTYLEYRKGEKAVPFYTSTWRYSKQARSMVFLYHDIHTRQLRTHSIRDYIK